MEQSPPISPRHQPTLAAAVVVCTRRRPELLRNCLAGISRLDPHPDEVIVVDNSEGDRETESAAREFGVKYIVEPIPGLSRARNRGLRESKSEIIAYLDDDAVPDRQWLKQILEPFAESSVAIVTGEVVTFESCADRHQESIRTLSKKNPLWFETASFGGMGIGANMALRRETFGDWNGFDERLGRGAPFIKGGEEAFAIARLLSLGFTAVHTPAAIVSHPLKPMNVEEEASNAIAYWWFLFFESPGHRMELVNFILTRLRQKPLVWRQEPEFGPVIKGGWKLRIKAALLGTLLYLRTRTSQSS